MQNEKGQQTQQRNKETTGQAPQREQGAQGKDMQKEKGEQTQQREQGQGQTPQRQQGQQGQTQPGGQARPQAQGGANKDGGSATLTTEQRTRVRQTVLTGGNVPRVTNVNFAITVGTSVPTTVRVVEVSPVLVEIHPEWRGHLYFVVGDDIIIVDRNHRIIAVISA
jgi:hypothetical protein